MHTYIAILRGINVGGKRMIKMQLLKELFGKLSYQNISTYIQSGNVVFQTNKTSVAKIELQIIKAITETFGFDVPVIVMEYETLNKIINENKFLKDKSKNTDFLHVTFLADAPLKENEAKINSKDYLPDEFFIIDKAVYLYCPNSYSNSKLTNGFFETKLKVNATTRNWKTTLALNEMAEQLL